ncbi:MAG: UDP-N-acetylmuramoyl-L-alanyl-D-glutamate--2,6-diaminopimelate ligase [Bacteroidota bacterium]
MLLKDIIYKAGIVEIIGKTDVDITSICFNSALVSGGNLFVAVKGTQSDGHIYIDNAIEKGALVIVCEIIPDDKKAKVTYVKVKNSSIALAFICANFYNNPSEKLKLTGITGTNGKTTTATLLFNIFRNTGYKIGLISTVRNQINDKVIPSTHTTPDPLKLNQLLSEMVNEGCTHCFMEVSSHALAQHRVTALKFAGGVFSNLTHDHLDFHLTFDEYIRAKKSFFDMLPGDAFALVNIDDKNGRVMVQNTKAKIRTYGLKTMSDFKCRVIENNFSGLLLNIDGSEVSCKLIGSFNAYNLLAVYATASLLGMDKLTALSEISNLESVEGRFEYIISLNKITGIVDYAHTPDALQNVLSTIKDIRTGNEKVITIIGCGGDRDSAKRSVMSRIACELSDKVILTSDNPRSEDPNEIIRQMQQGVQPHHYKKALSIVDRREAVKTACSLAQSGDIILLAGKGHEKYQEIKGVKYPFDDKQVLQESFDAIINSE